MSPAARYDVGSIARALRHHWETGRLAMFTVLDKKTMTKVTVDQWDKAKAADVVFRIACRGIPDADLTTAQAYGLCIGLAESERFDEVRQS